MRQFGHLVISFQVDGKIHPEVIWNPKRISVREIHPLRASVIEFSDRQRNGSPSTVFTRKSNIDSFTQLVITHKIGIVWLIKITWIPFRAVDLLLFLRRIDRSGWLDSTPCLMPCSFLISLKRCNRLKGKALPGDGLPLVGVAHPQAAIHPGQSRV